MERKVIRIPANTCITEQPVKPVQKRRVAAYARVSTELEEQQNSYENQISYYTSYIQSRPEWEFVNIYSDEGISGTGIQKREGFKSMLADAFDGKIDLIITKSITRFARNTLDSISTIKKLRTKNVECFFEKENIWTMDGNSDLLITILSGISQSESYNISTNVTWALRKRNAQGKVTFSYKNFLGYAKGADGNPVIVEDEAKVIKKIYTMYLHGQTPYTIAKELNKAGICTPSGKESWKTSGVLSILTNEKYCGNAILQKTYTEDYLTHKSVKNNGQVQMWYIENSHPGIISPEQFRYVQQEIQKRKADNSDTLSYSPFGGHIFCATCGGCYGRKTWHSNDKYKTTVWHCNNRYKKDKSCDNPLFREQNLKDAFITVFNDLISRKEEILSVHKGDKQKYSCSELYKELNKMTERSRKLRETISGWTAYKNIESHQKYIDEYNSIQKEREVLNEKIASVKCLQYKTNLFLKVLKNKKEGLKYFSSATFRQTVDRIVVGKDATLKFIFNDGTESSIKVNTGVREYERRKENSSDSTL